MRVRRLLPFVIGTVLAVDLGGQAVATSPVAVAGTAAPAAGNTVIHAYDLTPVTDAR